MLNITPGRFAWTFLVGFFICSNLNWGIAEFFLNDWSQPRFDGFLRSGENAAFFGTYTFISGWGNVNWWPLMVTAVCDAGSIIPGTVLIAWLQQRGTG